MLALISSTASLGFTLPSSAAAVGGARCSAVEMISVGEKLPKSVLSKAGLSGKKGALFFYGADDAPSCSKELSEFEVRSPAFMNEIAQARRVRRSVVSRVLESRRAASPTLMRGASPSSAFATALAPRATTARFG